MSSALDHDLHMSTFYETRIGLTVNYQNHQLIRTICLQFQKVIVCVTQNLDLSVFVIPYKMIKIPDTPKLQDVTSNLRTL